MKYSATIALFLGVATPMKLNNQWATGATGEEDLTEEFNRLKDTTNV